MSSHDHLGGEPAPRGGFLTSRAGLVLIGFLAIAGVYLWMEHRAHVLGALIWLPLLAFPLMHLFMHGHGGHGDHAGHERDRRDGGTA